jgi:hypothetical protein
MVTGITIGVGFSIASFFARYIFPGMPKYVSWPGMGIGIAIAIWSLIPPAFPLANDSLPGFSATIGLKINDAAKLGRQYFFEYSDPEGAKSSFYLLETNRFAFSVTDTRGETYALEVSLGSEGVPLGRLIFLTCQVGVSANATHLRVLVNRKDVQNRSYPFAIDLGSKAWVKGTIGADNKGEHNSAFEIFSAGFGHVTMPDKDIASLIARLSQYLRDIHSPLANEL